MTSPDSPLLVAFSTLEVLGTAQLLSDKLDVVSEAPDKNRNFSL